MTDAIKSKTIKKDFISGTGRRKTSVAGVFLYKEKGEFIVNGLPIENYFSGEKFSLIWKKPFHIVGVSHPNSNFSASIKVTGSGKNSQLDAVILGISRALAKIDDEYEKLLSRNGLLRRDPRMVERKKYWFKKARKQPQFSKR